MGELPETACLAGPGDPLGGSGTKTFAKARYRILQGARATACLRVRSTDSLRVIPAEEFVGMEGLFVEIEEHIAVSFPCCEVVDVNTRHARTYARAGAHVDHTT